VSEMDASDPALLASRATAYSVISLALQYPVEEVADLLLGGWAREALSSCLPGLRELGYGSVEELRRLVDALSSDWDASDLRREYTRLFISSHPRLPCPPYESVYVSEEREVMSEQVSEILGILRGWGLGLSDSFRDLPEHIAVELELAAYLLEQMKLAIQEGDPDEAERAERDLRRLVTHLTRWVPEFAGCVRAESKVEFYKIVVSSMEAFVRDESASLGVK